MTHQANDKLLPDIYTFLGWPVTQQKKSSLAEIKLNRSIDHRKKNKILASPGMLVLYVQTVFPKYHLPMFWEVCVAENQNDRILGSKVPSVTIW